MRPPLEPRALPWRPKAWTGFASAKRPQHHIGGNSVRRAATSRGGFPGASSLLRRRCGDVQGWAASGGQAMVLAVRPRSPEFPVPQNPITKGPAPAEKLARPVPSSWQTRCGVRSTASTDPQQSRQSNLSDLRSHVPRERTSNPNLGQSGAAMDATSRRPSACRWAPAPPQRCRVLGVGCEANGCRKRDVRSARS